MYHSYLFLNYRTSTMTSPFTSTINYFGEIQYLEHVVVTMTVTTSIGSRGDIRIELTSPSGTLSTLLSHRDNDGSSGGYIDWSFMSVMFWGEDPIGEWSLSVITRSPTEAIVSDVEFQFYGVSSIPESVANIPDECHSDCRRGCAEEGSVYIEAAKRNEKENNQQDDTYTTSWVVEITNGGKQMADAVADEYGFKNLGKLKVYLCVCM